MAAMNCPRHELQSHTAPARAGSDRSFGLVLRHVMMPLLMGLLFFLILTPVGVLMRITGQTPMRLKRDTKAASYWIVRTPPGPDAHSMKKQF